jgi:hypothetical protein
MFIYIICFSILYILLRMVRKKNLNRSINGHILVGLVLLLPAFIAGFRDYSIGTDTLQYTRIFTSIINTNFATLTSEILLNGDILYVIYQKMIGIFTSNPGFYLGLTSYLTILVFYIALIKYDDKIHYENSILIYSLILYNVSLNLVRQSFAMSFLLLGTVLFLKRKHVNGIFFSIIAIMIHPTALVIVFFILMMILLKKERIYYRIFIVVMMALFLTFLLVPTITTFVSIGLLPIKYLFYIDSLEFVFNTRKIIVYIVPLLFVISNYKKLILKNSNNMFWISLLVVQFVLSQMVDNSYTVYRIVIFFSLSNVLLFTDFLSLSKIRFSSLSLSHLALQSAKLLSISYFCFYWFYYFIMLVTQNTYPYLSIFG